MAQFDAELYLRVVHPGGMQGQRVAQRKRVVSHDRLIAVHLNAFTECVSWSKAIRARNQQVNSIFRRRAGAVDSRVHRVWATVKRLAIHLDGGARKAL